MCHVIGGCVFNGSSIHIKHSLQCTSIRNWKLSHAVKYRYHWNCEWMFIHANVEVAEGLLFYLNEMLRIGDIPPNWFNTHVALLHKVKTYMVPKIGDLLQT